MTKETIKALGKIGLGVMVVEVVYAGGKAKMLHAIKKDYPSVADEILSNINTSIDEDETMSFWQKVRLKLVKGFCKDFTI